MSFKTSFIVQQGDIVDILRPANKTMQTVLKESSSQGCPQLFCAQACSLGPGHFLQQSGAWGEEKEAMGRKFVPKSCLNQSLGLEPWKCSFFPPHSRYIRHSFKTTKIGNDGFHYTVFT